MKMASLSVVIPVFNSGDNLEPLINRLQPVLENACSDYELILVDDASRDDSWRRIRAIADGRPWVRPFRLMRNYGQHNALLCGIRAARGEVTVTMDDDLQHRPRKSRCCSRL